MPSPAIVWYVRVLGALLLLQGGFGAVLKAVQGRADDLPHNGLHVVSGALGLALAAGARAGTRAHAFALRFGAFYFLLGAVGWVWTNPLGVLPLGPADHVFHLVIGGVTLAVALARRPLAVQRRDGAGRARARTRSFPSPGRSTWNASATRRKRPEA